MLASHEADQSIRGWLRHGADVLGVDFLVIELNQDWRSRITAAQTTQLMVNLPAELVDDLLDDPVSGAVVPPPLSLSDTSSSMSAQSTGDQVPRR